MGESTLPSGDSAATMHVIRCAECHELVPADRVRHREERVKVAARPAPGQWRSGGPPIFRPTPRGSRLATGVRTAAPLAHSAFAIERVPVCVDCLRRQRIGLYGVCGIAAACLLAGAFLYSQQIDTPSSQEVALQAPQKSTLATAKPETPAATETPTGPAPIWAKVIPTAPPPVAPPPLPLPPVTAATAPSASPPVSPVTASAGAPPGPGPDTPAEQPASPEVAPDTSSTTTVTTAPPPAASTADATASADPPIWKADRKASSRKVAKATPPAPRGAPSANAVALRNSGYAALEQRHYRDALTLLQQSTMMGDPYAPMYIGQLFEGGIGVPRDVGQASYWYGIAIDRGNSVALTAFNRMRTSPY